MLVGYYRNAHGQPFYVVVVNAGNRRKIVDWVVAHLPPERAEAPGEEVVFTDVSRLWAMLAIQGPRSVEILEPLIDVDLRSMRYYRGGQVQILHPAARRQGGIISRTGYTGEDGFELSVGSDIALGVWEAILELGQPLGLVPTGLGARDTLRLEAGMPLYGHELSEQIDPFTAGLGFACHLVGYDFPGRDALRRIEKEPRTAVRVGLELAGRRVAREGYPICKDGQPVGRVTSGTFSPTLEKADRHGLRAARADRAGHGADRRYPRSSGRGSRGRASLLSPQQQRSQEVTPDKLLYAKTHEWVAVETAGGEKLATVGLSDFALKALTDLVYMNLPPVGRKVQAGQPLGEVESVKAVSDLYSPVDGEIVAVQRRPSRKTSRTCPKTPTATAGW